MEMREEGNERGHMAERGGWRKNEEREMTEDVSSVANKVGKLRNGMRDRRRGGSRRCRGGGGEASWTNRDGPSKARPKLGVIAMAMMSMMSMPVRDSTKGTAR